MWTQDLRESWPRSLRRTARNAAYLSLQGHEDSLWLKVSPALICLEATLGHQLLLCSEKGPGLAYKEEFAHIDGPGFNFSKMYLGEVRAGKSTQGGTLHMVTWV